MHDSIISLFSATSNNILQSFNDLLNIKLSPTCMKLCPQTAVLHIFGDVAFTFNYQTQTFTNIGHKHFWWAEKLMEHTCWWTLSSLGQATLPIITPEWCYIKLTGFQTISAPHRTYFGWVTICSYKDSADITWASVSILGFLQFLVVLFVHALEILHVLHHHVYGAADTQLLQHTHTHTHTPHTTPTHRV